ncbi:Dolichyl-diphosphooligosaccharide-protein glycosyltransferase subunit [Wickerhamomyces ciferrii]|uniref:Dolichyl-diphosphooligosaccharide--protein glycosyltransferase subunit OST2 n=1 Tax=Wickerhamomyces ciferrii (strain ATCC 14091 / BCRC 22168 / CBS 111 / JCM 3599 / NBRC 0793 / NRRL Y-1031 F-60-10) TaxID=1206466 RepID=K0KRD1_WICCF|nr:Dolichyl-diphosphooligosaccharide-protein glycosyltransferase subunit [Wickerhamomyces ciferrii]CCH43868.1 Dolichyl-diphosphooligosaccharide-protein glycosyltransferase subunit [Wickerhamomyces ciferrii]
MAPKAKQNKAKAAAVAVSNSSKDSSSSTNTNAIGDFTNSIEKSINSYFENLTPRLKLIDIFLTFLVLVASVQFIFVILVGNFPFNAFLGGFISTVGQFVLTVSLRLQSVSQNKDFFKKITPERALGDYIFASLILHFIIYHFIN